MRRKLTIVILCITVIGVGTALWLLWPRSYRDEDFFKIQVGMTRSEVEATVGVPTHQAAEWGEWESEQACLLVWFDADDRVERCGVALPPNRTILDKLRRWLRL